MLYCTRRAIKHRNLYFTVTPENLRGMVFNPLLAGMLTALKTIINTNNNTLTIKYYRYQYTNTAFEKYCKYQYPTFFVTIFYCHRVMRYINVTLTYILFITFSNIIFFHGQLLIKLIERVLSRNGKITVVYSDDVNE